MYDLFYLNFLYQSFCKKIEKVLLSNLKPYVFGKLFYNKKQKKEPLIGLIANNKNYNDLLNQLNHEKLKNKKLEEEIQRLKNISQNQLNELNLLKNENNNLKNKNNNLKNINNNLKQNLSNINQSNQSNQTNNN